MISTGCEGCCFLKHDNIGNRCAVAQLCITKDGRTYAPGYCKLCRSHKWAKKQGETDTGKLIGKVVCENELKFDLLVFFDEAIDSIGSLYRTFGNRWFGSYAKKIIIADVTGFGQRKNLAFKYLKEQNLDIPVIVDSSSVHEPVSERESTIRRLSRQITSPFFMTIPAGGVVLDMDSLAKNVQNVPSRVIKWTFPWIMGGTAIVPNGHYYGLFITKPYLALTRSQSAGTFSEQLIKEEKETGMGLSWFCQECKLV